MAAAAPEGLAPPLQAQSTPEIRSIEPTKGSIHSRSAAIFGSHFGKPHSGGTVTFNGVQAHVSSWSDTMIRVQPPRLSYGTYPVVVTVGGRKSNAVDYRVLPFATPECFGAGLAEPDGTKEITVRRRGTIEEEATISLTYKGTATRGSDYTAPESVTIAAGRDRATVELRVIDDTEEEGRERIRVETSSPDYLSGACSITLEDDDSLDETETLRHRTSSADPGYHGLTLAEVEVTITDNDGAGVTVRPARLTLPEGGEGRYTVVLATEPSAPVTVRPEAPPEANLAVSPPALVFTAADWDRPRTVTVTAGQDRDTEDGSGRITHRIASPDTVYAGVAVEAVEVEVLDDDGAGGLTLSATLLRITEGNRGSYTVRPDQRPEFALTVALSVPPDSDLAVEPRVLRFSPADWETPREVTVTVAEDADLDDEVQRITHTLASAGARGARGQGGTAPSREHLYLGGRLLAIDSSVPVEPPPVVVAARVLVTIDDDDDPGTPGVPALTNALELTEGYTGAYTLELSSRPAAEVAITLSASPGAGVAVEPRSLTFTPRDWDTPQWVTVTAARDDDTLDDTETIRHAASSTDPDYHGIEVADVRVEIRDLNQPPPPPPGGGITAAPDPCSIPAGRTTCPVTLRWNASNSARIQIRRGNQVVKDSTAASGTVTVDLQEGSPTFELYAYPQGGGTESPVGSVTVTVTATPTGTLTALEKSCTIPAGKETCDKKVTLTWTSQHTRHVQIRRKEDNKVFITSSESMGSVMADVVEGSNTFLLYNYDPVAGNRIGEELDSDTVTGIRVNRPPPPDLSDQSATVGTPFTYRFAAVIDPDGDTVTYSDAYSPAKPAWLGFNAGSRTFSGTPQSGDLGETRVTVTATDDGSPRLSSSPSAFTLTVSAKPTCTLSASPADIRSGDSSTLSWTSTNATRLILNPGSIDVTDDHDKSRSVSPAATTTYTLTATGPGGEAPPCQATVRVVKGAISASPNPCTIAAGGTTCTTTLNWNGMGTTGLLVRVSHNGAASGVFASSGASGSQSASWIQGPPHTYVFTLYDYMG